MRKLINSHFFLTFIPTHLLLFWFVGWGMFESAVYFGMTMFSYGNQTLTTKVDVIIITIILTGALFYWLINHSDKLVTKIVKSVFFIVLSFLLGPVEVIIFFIFYFLSTFVLGSLHLLFYGVGINGNVIDYFEIKVAVVVFLVIILGTVMFFLRSKRSATNWRESLEKSLLFLCIFLFLASPLIFPLVLILPGLILK